MNIIESTNKSRAEDLPVISVVFVTFDRLITLQPTFASFLNNTDYPRDRLELIVCDDCSPKAVQAELRRMPFDLHCLATQRRGLGANVNQGLRAASGDLIFQLQDDWMCQGAVDYLRRATAAIRAAPDIGLIILNQHPMPLPIRRKETIGEDTLRIFDNRPNTKVKMVGEHAYTDWPHLKRRAFHEQLGFYAEGVPMWEMELDFACRVNAQTTTFIADIEGLDGFSHIGADHSYNTGTRRARLAKRIAALPGGSAAIATYSLIKRKLG